MNKKIVYGLVAGGVAMAAVGLLTRTGWVGRWDNAMSDGRARLLAKPSSATEQVKLVLVDQSSLDWASQTMGLSWPWPREVYGPLLDYLKRHGATTAVLDVLYTEPSAYGVADDEALGAAVGRFGNLVGAVFLGQQTDQTTSWPEGVAANPLDIEGLEAWLTAHPGAAREIVSAGAAFPVPEVAMKTAWLANVRDGPDGDGVFRRAAPFRIFDGHVLPSLGMAGWLAGLDERPVTATIASRELTVGGRHIPLDRDGRMILKFRGPSGTHQAFTAAAVIQSELRLLEGGEPPIRDGSVFKDTTVVFGFSAPGLKDLRPSPMSGDYPGAEIYATMLDNLLAGDFLRDAPAAAHWGWLLLVALAAGVAAASARNGWHSTGAALVLIPLPTLAGLAAWQAGIVLPVAGPTLGVVLALLGGAIVNFILEGRQKLFLKGAFKHYLSPEVIDQIVRDPGSLKLGGERRELTIFFSDLQGFSAISERLGPEDLTTLLNDYLTDMTGIILEEGGTLDKYVGDAIVAFWNAPLSQSDHAVRAVRAAVRCQRKLAERRAELEARTGAVLRMRIGLNTGPVVVGNMGSRERFDYTMLGDAANLASRLEGANKALGTYLMIAEATWALTDGAFPGRELGQLRVVGRHTPVRVYEATGLEGGAPEESNRAFEAALALAKAGRWPDAAVAFDALADDPAAQTYAQKCRALEAADPAAAWDGIWNLTEK
ncbi:MAG: adenylate/guanylate cyclase domain-containing protein [Kiritimatiellia bacterium]|jgi:adenylate cyclase|nr:adenylate/guanylate cyclase domain-containing protein [Kiritimatiellia bacterium]